jgi:hypothetical protein
MNPSPEDRFLDDIGLHFESMGAPKMMGRMLALLMVCDPPHQSSQQIMERLGCTSGTVSTNSRLLMMHGMVSKVEVPGARASHFRLSENAFAEAMKLFLKDSLGMKAAADAYVASKGDDTPPVIAELAEFSTFLEERLSALLAEWHSRRS